jgi:endonuclease G
MNERVIDSVLRDRQLVEEMQERNAGTRSLPRARVFSIAPEVIDRALVRPETLNTRPVTEAIILLFGRPALLVRNNTFEVPDSDTWKGRLTPARSRLEQTLRSVGRIEVVNHFTYQWLGSGFMIDRNIAVTNRHVAMEFARKAATGFTFSKNFLGQTIEARIDYREEHMVNEAFEIAVRRVLFMTDDDPALPDLAFLELEESPNLPPPIPLFSEEITDRDHYIAAIGYPARDFRNPASALEQVFGDIFDVKRLSPGTVTQMTDASGLPDFVFLHTCSTLGGSSGSPLVDINTGAVVGLHFGGQFGIANFAVKAGKVLEFLERSTGRPLRSSRQDTATATEDHFRVERPASDYARRQGYDPFFLGTDVEVPLPTLSAELESHAVRVNGTRRGLPSHVLKYTHFSIAMNGERRLAYYTACNVDGRRLRHIPRSGDKWYFDPRIDRDTQVGNELYRGNDLDRGHLVRRLDPVWGDADEASDANEDTFHWTNCSPQHSGFNQRTWLELEEYILDNAGAHDLRINVYTGPVFDSGDPEYRDVQLPRQYWKVVAMVEEETQRLFATAYIISQSDLISNLEFAFGKFRTYQIPIADIENRTGLSFGNLRDYDPLGQAETLQIRPIEELSDMVLSRARI